MLGGNENFVNCICECPTSYVEAHMSEQVLLGLAQGGGSALVLIGLGRGVLPVSWHLAVLTITATGTNAGTS